MGNLINVAIKDIEKMSTGEKIKFLRKRMGWHQSQLGNMVGLVQAGISLIERGIRPVDSDMVRKLSEVFNVQESYFFNNDREVEDKSSVTYTLLKQLVEQNIIEDVENIDEDVLTLILSAVKTDLKQIIKNFNNKD